MKTPSNIPSKQVLIELIRTKEQALHLLNLLEKISNYDTNVREVYLITHAFLNKINLVIEANLSEEKVDDPS